MNLFAAKYAYIIHSSKKEYAINVSYKHRNHFGYIFIVAEKNENVK